VTPFCLGISTTALFRKTFYVDCTKLSVIARLVGGEQRIGISKTRKEVVIVTDAKLEIVCIT
jgi:hypothetical protein